MFIYLTPIFLLAWCLTGALWGGRKSNYINLFWGSMIVMMIAGFRWMCDADFSGYKDLYADTPPINMFDFETMQHMYGEPGYLYITSIFKAIGAEFYVISFLCAVISISIKSFVALKLSRQSSLVISLYFCIHFITIEFIQIRWALATSLLIFAFYFQQKKFFKEALLCYVSAVSVHYLSLLYIIIAIMMELKQGKYYWSVLCGMLVLGLSIKLGILNFITLLNTETYILNKALGNLAVPASTLGLFSYLKLFYYVVIYIFINFVDPHSQYENVDSDKYWFRLSVSCLALTLSISFAPILHHRSVVITDFFCLIYVINKLEKTSLLRVKQSMELKTGREPNGIQNMARVYYFLSISGLLL